MISTDIRFGTGTERDVNGSNVTDSYKTEGMNSCGDIYLNKLFHIEDIWFSI